MIHEYFSPDERELRPVGQGGRRLLFKGGSSNSSNASSTTNQDNRIATDSGLVATGGSALQKDSHDDLSTKLQVNDNSNKSHTENTSNSSSTSSYSSSNFNSTSVTNITDGGAVKSAMDAASGGFKDLLASTTSMKQFESDNYKTLLSTADKLLSNVGSTQKALADSYSNAVGKAYDSAKASASGTMDNKTIMILGLAAAGAVAFVMAK